MRAFSVVEVAVVAAAVVVVIGIAGGAVSRASEGARKSATLRRVYEDFAAHRAKLLALNLGPVACMEVSQASVAGQAVVSYVYKKDCPDSGSTVEATTSEFNAVFTFANWCVDGLARPVTCTTPLTATGAEQISFWALPSLATEPADGRIRWAGTSRLTADFDVEANGDTNVMPHVYNMGRLTTANPTPGKAPAAVASADPSGLMQ